MDMSRTVTRPSRRVTKVVTEQLDLARAHDALHARARDKGVNPLVYWLARAVLQPFFHLYFRLSRIGREHVRNPAGHLLRQPPLVPRPVRDRDDRAPADVLRRQGGAVPLPARRLDPERARRVPRQARRRRPGHARPPPRRSSSAATRCSMFAEGTRIRPGALGRPKRGVGRLALETGAPVVPVAVIGTEAVRKGWRIRPHKVRVRIGSPLTFPKVEQASPQLAAAVTDRIWPNVMLQWEWLGGLPPLRRAAVIGAGSWGAAVAAMLARAGLEVDLGHRAAELELSRHDLVCFAVPSAALPAAVAEHGAHIPSRAGVLVLSKGLVAAARHAARRLRGGADGELGGRRARRPGARRRARRRRLARVRRDGPRVPPPGHRRADRRRLRRRRDRRRHRRRAGRLREGRRGARRRGRRPRRAERRRQRRRQGVRRGRGATRAPRAPQPGTFAGLAGAGDLVATVLAAESRNRRAGELLAQGVAGERDRARARPDGRGGALRPAARRARAGGRRRAPRCCAGSPT